jgi:preprotein translocase subunit SecA
MVTLQTVDHFWREHLLAMDQMKEGIGLRGYAQVNPLIEYKREGLAIFQEMIDRIKRDTVRMLFRIQVARNEAEELEAVQQQQPVFFSHGDGGGGAKAQPTKRASKVGRNEPCPCGSGRKYKKCCGR